MLYLEGVGGADKTALPFSILRADYMKLTELLTFIRNNVRDVEVQINPEVTMTHLADVKNRPGAIVMIDLYLLNTRPIGEKFVPTDCEKVNWDKTKDNTPLTYGKPPCR